MAQRHQHGWLKKEMRAQGETWVLFFRTTRRSDGKRVENKVPIGLVRHLPEASSAWAEVERPHVPINRVDMRRGLTFGDLAQHYAEHELVEGSESIRPKAHTTIKGYERVLRNRLLPRWGNRIALGIEPLEVEQWLRVGKIGRLTPAARRRTADLFLAIARSDGQRLTDSLIQITAPEHPIDRALIGREIDRVLELYVDVSLEKLRFGEAIGEVLQLVRRHGLLLPGTLVDFFKALAMCEGVVQNIDPDSSFAHYLQPMVRKLIYQAFAGPDLLGRLRDSVADAAELSIALPRRIDRVLGEIEQGNLRVWTRVEDIDPLMKRLEHLVARSNATLLAAACIVGLAVVMQFYHPRGWQAWIGALFWIAVAFAIIDYVRTLLTLRRRK